MTKTYLVLFFLILNAFITTQSYCKTNNNDSIIVRDLVMTNIPKDLRNSINSILRSQVALKENVVSQHETSSVVNQNIILSTRYTKKKSAFRKPNINPKVKPKHILTGVAILKDGSLTISIKINNMLNGSSRYATVKFTDRSKTSLKKNIKRLVNKVF